MLRSMTAFATRSGARGDCAWTWEMRGVNGKGLDLRLRLPEGIEGLEAALRVAAGRRLARGNVTASLRLQSAAAAAGLVLNEAALDAALAALAETERRADARGLTFAPATAAQVLGLRGILEPGEAVTAQADLAEVLAADFDALLAEFTAMRETEGAALAEVLAGQIDRIEALTGGAGTMLAARAEAIAESHRAALARVIEKPAEIAPERIAQELALVAVRLDVTEELDRLRAHVAAARDLLAQGSPVGRKLDFLAQEFMREANTLCSKAQNAGLTAIGLELKTVIDQMREQVQNVE
ncbi:YicC/YloC family endoribonuclease [Roseovarius autotrophicus]|uniref:YicC/YloC family endoribonuclease n=1 Tax=Roseovarius autotrophicus TaxID=2824121 RepID=UPI001B395206|nr:YicC/YloC family endoribonuclease [Roseovarius autotrophicus]